MIRLIAAFLITAGPLALLASEPAQTKPQFQAKCSCGWSAPKRDQLDRAMKDGEGHGKTHKDHDWTITRTNKK
jgi:hypothetical protein